MTDFQLYALIGLGLYFLLMIAIGIRASKSETHDGFVIGSRDVGLIPTIASVASSFRDGAGAVFWVGAGLGAAYGGLWMLVGFSLASLFFVFFGDRVRLIAKEHNFITIGEVIRYFIGNITEKMVSIIVLIFALAIITMQLFVSGNIFAKILDVDSAIGIASVASVVGIYMFFGGYSTVIKTDFFQFFIIISLVIFPFFITPPKEAMLDFSTFVNVDRDFGLGVFFLGVFYILSGAETWQRVFSARSAKVIKIAFPASALFLTLMTLSLIWVGMGTKDMLGDVSENDALFKIFTLTDQIPVILLAYFAIVIMTITMSTLDSFCYLFAATLSKNILHERVTAKRENYVWLARLLIVFTLVLCSFFALTITDFIEFIFSAASLVYILGPVYVLTATGILRKNLWMDYYVTLALISSCGVYIYMFANQMFSNLMMTGVPVFIMIGLLLIALPFQGKLKS